MTAAHAQHVRQSGSSPAPLNDQFDRDAGGVVTIGSDLEALALAYGSDDWVFLSSVSAGARLLGITDSREARRLAFDVVGDMLARGLIVVGAPDSEQGGFKPAPDQRSALELARADCESWEPGHDDWIPLWFDLTPAGVDVAARIGAVERARQLSRERGTRL